MQFKLVFETFSQPVAINQKKFQVKTQIMYFFVCYSVDMSLCLYTKYMSMGFFFIHCQLDCTLLSFKPIVNRLGCHLFFRHLVRYFFHLQ